MNDTFERTQMEAPVVYFKLLSQHLDGNIYENHENPISGQRIEPPRYEILHCFAM
jgi:hypothetical protein